LEGLRDALACQGVWRVAVKWAERAAWEGAFAIDGAAKAIDDAPNEAGTDIDACSPACGNNFAAGMDFLHFAQRHEEDTMVAESHDFRLESAETV
jgi:hypothetical protein